MRYVKLVGGKLVAVDDEMSGGKRVADETEDMSTKAKKPRFAAGVKMLPRRPSCELLHREPHLQVLSAALTKPLSHRAIDMAITGTAGVGKTELVLNFVANHADQFQHILWINAESTETAESCFLEVAKMLEMEINKKQVHVPLLINKIYNLCSETKCMIIFDNAANPEMLQKFLPPFHIDKSSMFTVVTSQFNEWDCETELKVECFTSEQSQQFLKQHLRNITDSESKEISEMLGNLPLALQLTVSFINFSNKFPDLEQEVFSPEEFINTMKSSPENFLNYRLATSENINYSKNLNQIYKNTLFQLKKLEKGKHLIKILSLMSFIKPVEINYNIFRYLNLVDNNIIADSDLNYFFSVLEKFSLFIEKDEHNVSILPIMQTVIRKSLADIQVREYLDHILQLILGEVEFEVYHLQHRLHDFTLGLHFEDIWEHAQKYPHFIKTYSRIPVAIANEQAGEDEFANCISFVERQLRTLEKLGLDNKHFIKIHIPYLHSLFKLNFHIKVIIVADKILPHVLADNKIAWDILQTKAGSLFKLNNLISSFDITYDIHKQRMEYCDKHINCEASIRSLLHIFKLMCKIVCKMYENGSNTVVISLWMKLFEEKCSKPYCKHLIEFLPKVEKYFKIIDKSEHLLLLYDQLQCFLVLSDLYVNALNKAKFLCELGKYEDSWDICVSIKWQALRLRELELRPDGRAFLMDYIDNLRTRVRMFV